MGKKRKNPSNQSESSYQKRSRSNHDNLIMPLAEDSQPRLDPTYGQRGAFPGLDGTNEADDLFYGPANDGLEYLRMVRFEAKTVPNLLVAPSQVKHTDQSSQVDEDHTELSQGYYADGAYMATVRSHSASGLLDESIDYSSEDDLDPQEAYYVSLGSRFQKFRSAMQSTPPIQHPQSTSNFTAIASSLYNATHAKWRYIFLYTTPSTYVLAEMQQESVMRGLQIMETLLTKKNLLEVKEGRNLGAWCWGLLGRCREVGQMRSEDVGIIRILGRKALGLSRKMKTHMLDVEEKADDEAEHDLENPYEDGIENGEVMDALYEDSKSEKLNAVGAEDTNGVEGMVSSKLNSTDYDGGNKLPLPDGVNQNSLNSASDDPPLPQAPESRPTDTATALSAGSPTDLLHLTKMDLLSKLRSEAPPSPAQPQDIAASAIQDNEDSKILRALATLDVIVTIVGEVYGQRDLLDGREAWGEVE